MFLFCVSPLFRVKLAEAVESTIQSHFPLSKSHEPLVGVVGGGKVGVVLSSLQHMMPPALPTDMNEQPSRSPEAGEYIVRRLKTPWNEM